MPSEGAYLTPAYFQHGRKEYQSRGRRRAQGFGEALKLYVSIRISAWDNYKMLKINF